MGRCVWKDSSTSMECSHFNLEAEGLVYVCLRTRPKYLQGSSKLMPPRPRWTERQGPDLGRARLVFYVHMCFIKPSFTIKGWTKSMAEMLLN
uniref:Uncharacterized protein n=1 Tax=Timema douglasi TaxID=61478 RepID=A0A7R8VI50_TIMDO|nr:unnamed protein product [Timema douglasi]